MAWLRDGAGLPRFQQPPRSLPDEAAPASNGGRAGSGSLDGNGLAHAYSTDTQRSTEEEEELSRELTMELMADLGIGDRGSLGSAGGGARSHACSHRGSARPSRKASEALPGSDAEAGGAAAGSADPGAHWDWVSEEEKEEELQPSLYDQLGGGVVVKGVVDDFYANVLADPRLAHFFDGVDMSRHARKFLMFVTYVLGGPDEYLQLNPQPWPQLYAVHERLITDSGLNETHFDIVKGLFGDALARAGATPLVISQAAAVMETTRRILFPLDAPQPQAAEQQPAAAQQQQQQPAAEQQARGCPAGAAAAGRRPQ